VRPCPEDQRWWGCSLCLSLLHCEGAALTHFNQNQAQSSLLVRERHSLTRLVEPLTHAITRTRLQSCSLDDDAEQRPIAGIAGAATTPKLSDSPHPLLAHGVARVIDHPMLDGRPLSDAAAARCGYRTTRPGGASKRLRYACAGGVQCACTKWRSLYGCGCQCPLLPIVGRAPCARGSGALRSRVSGLYPPTRPSPVSAFAAKLRSSRIGFMSVADRFQTFVQSPRAIARPFFA